MIHYFDHRLGTYDGQTQAQANMGTLPRLTPQQQNDPDFVVQPRYWVQEFNTLDEKRSKPDKPVYSAMGVKSRLEAKYWNHDWLLGWRDICRSTDERTVISAAIPRAAVGDKYLLALTEYGPHLLQANLSTFVLDYAARQKVAGTSLKYYLIKQFPVLPPRAYQAPVLWLTDTMPGDWIRQRVLELSFTAWDIKAFARDLGDNDPPFQWDEERRTLIRAELDAAYFQLYGLQRDEVEYVMDTFDALRRREEKPQNFGEFRTKRLILERYDAMSEASRTGEPYQTILDPPPGQGPRHPERDALRGADGG